MVIDVTGMYGYSKKVMELFKHPHNIGEIKNPSSVGKVGNVFCGDVMWMYLKIENKNGKEIIKDIKVRTYGCVAAVSTSSFTTDLVKGKTIEQAMRITNNQIVKGVGGLPKIKIHCSVLAVDALKEAIYQYLKKKDKKIPKELEEVHKRVVKELKTIEHRHF